MPDIKDLIKSARQLISDYSEVASPQLAQCAGFLQSNKRAQTATKLYMSSAMTTDSIIILIEHGLIWDAISLFRSLLEGSARFCYLLSTATEEEEIKRFHEFEEVLSDKSMMSLEQRVANMKRGHLYKHDKTDAYLDRIEVNVKEIAQEISDEAAEVKRKWNFFNLSRSLRSECPEWAAMADQWELRYATSNFAIHKDGLIVGPDITHWMQEPSPDNPLVRVWAPSLLSFCVGLVRDRLIVLMRKFDLDCSVLIDVMKRNCAFAKLATDMELEAREKFCAENGGQQC